MCESVFPSLLYECASCNDIVVNIHADDIRTVCIILNVERSFSLDVFPVVNQDAFFGENIDFRGLSCICVDFYAAHSGIWKYINAN